MKHDRYPEAEDKFPAAGGSVSPMPAEPQQVRDARAAIAKLLGRLHPPPTAEWIEERTNQLMLQFLKRDSDEPPTKSP
jgi:hypothetical protein